MERAKLTHGEKTEPVNNGSGRTSLKRTGRKLKARKLVCRYCGSDDLAPSFIKRRDRRCRRCFSKRYGSAMRAKRARSNK
jgi:predicted Zn-ribbon and HTH transcriptional regulator